MFLIILIIACLTATYCEGQNKGMKKSKREKELDKKEADYDRNARRAAPRDGFPVLNFPKMISAKKADNQGSMRDKERVIGVVLGKEARAYPISIMGRHELANDKCGNKAIAVSW